MAWEWRASSLRAWRCATRSLSTHHLNCDSISLVLSNFLEQKLNIDRQKAIGLVELGSVYHSSAGSKETAQRVIVDQTINFGDYVRVYLDTTRYDTKSIDWERTILFDCSDFVVVEKPAGLPLPSLHLCPHHPARH
jgi:hypothetical protein